MNKPRASSSSSAYHVQTLDRAVAVLDLLSESETPLGLAQVASALQLNKSTAHRLLMVLERHHIVRRSMNAKFRLGLRLLNFGNRAIERPDVPRTDQHRAKHPPFRYPLN
jgi:DNA-binding IclR family transcriptional regulator